MASPQLENGFAMIASELVAAIFIADFTKYEKVILADLILALYGPKKLPTASVDHIRLAGMIGIDPRIMRRAAKSLVAKGVILGHDDATYSFVKDWETWLKDPGPSHLVGEGERRFVAYSAARFAAKVRSTHKSLTGTNQSPTDQSHRQNTGTNESPKTSVKGTIQSPKTAVNGTAWSPPTSDGSSASPGTARGVRRAEGSASAPILEDLIQEERDTNSRACAEDFEPFMSPPPEETPAPPAKADPLEAKIHSHALERTTSPGYPAGREDMAEHAVNEYRLWVKQGFSRAVVKDAIKKTLSFGDERSTNSLRFSSYLTGALSGISREMRGRATPPPPAPPNHSTLRKPTESLRKPAPAEGDVKGSRP